MIRLIDIVFILFKNRVGGMIVKVFHLFIDDVLKVKLKTFTVYYLEQFTSVLNRISEKYFFFL